MKTTKIYGLLLLFLSVTFISCDNDENLAKEISVPEEVSNLVSLDEARVELEKLLDDVYGTTPTTRSAGSHRKVIANAYTIKDADSLTRSANEDAPILHIFNFADDEGYAIMAGHKQMPSLLALAESGELLEGTVVDNPGTITFLELLQSQYQDELFNTPRGTIRYGDWENVVYKEGGYCPVKWGQGYPFNTYCPIVDNEKSLSGCVATAVGQLMSIYKYPTSFGEYSFDWNEMTFNPFGDRVSLAAREQIARLMSELGKKSNLDMQYGAESGADPKHIPRTLENFGYSNGGTLKDYNTSEVVDELKNGFPVLIGGFSQKEVTKFLGIKVKTTYRKGHRWLGHGLLERRRLVKTYHQGAIISTNVERQWYILCNWGWNGSDDGYYLSGAFNAKEDLAFPVSTRTVDGENAGDLDNFQYKITAVVGIRK